MSQSGYQECELVSNRAAVLLSGGSAADRKAWAEEAASAFATFGPLVEVVAAPGLEPALALARGVVFVPDLLALGEEAQVQLLRCLMSPEDRPKLVLGLPVSVPDALARGLLRPDVSYRLSTGRVDLSAPGVKDVIRARREKAAAHKQGRARPGGSAHKGEARRTGRR